MPVTKERFQLAKYLAAALLFGFFTSIVFPYSYKAVEKSKAREAFVLGGTVNKAYLKFLKDNHRKILVGTLANTCDTGACNLKEPGICVLTRCGYLPRHDWDKHPYSFSVGKSCPKDAATCIRRISGTGVYVYWGYDYAASGKYVPLGKAPSFQGIGTDIR